MQKAFKELMAIFVEYAGDEAFPLVPGHSYFLETDDSQAASLLRVHLAPLLEEYLSRLDRVRELVASLLPKVQTELVPPFASIEIPRTVEQKATFTLSTSHN